MTLAFPEFISLLFQSPFYMFIVVVILATLFIGGWVDSATAIVTAVSTRSLQAGWALGLAAACNFFGVLFITAFHSEIARRVYSYIPFPQDQRTSGIIILAAMMTFLVWALINWIFGVPASESHSMFSALWGSAMAVQVGGHLSFRGDGLPMLLGFILTPLVVSVFTVSILKILRKLLRSKDPEKVKEKIQHSQIFFLGATAFIHGARNGLKYLGILFLALQGPMSFGGIFVVPMWLMILVALVLSFGTYIGSHRIVRNLGQKIVRISLPMGLAVELASFINLIVGALFAIPISTNQTKISAIMAAGREQGKKYINWRKVMEITFLWLLSFPICGAMGYMMTKVFLEIVAK